MAGAITVERLRNITRLEFELPGRGVWLLTAGNGAGKTTLLACLRRIRHPNAFPVHFPSSLKSDQLDDYRQASITYRLGAEEVEYAYRGERWTPRPRTASHLLDKFGYPNVIYIGATADRITPRPDDFVPAKLRAVSDAIIDAANAIFETQKFSNLRFINLTTGDGNRAYVMQVSEKPRLYHSEKQFSLGELCILKLITRLAECPKKSLVLIDELEMALHPRAQVKLHEYLVGVAAKKDLTVIFSTHSVSLLKSVPRQNIILLDRGDDGTVKPIVGCFPAYAIGNITIGEERAPDVVLYVEDDAARSLVESLSALVVAEKYEDEVPPTFKVVPVGPFDSVIRFLSQHGAILPAGTKAFALLDGDVKSETVAEWEATKNYGQLDRLEKLKGTIAFLPWTPEVAIVTDFRDNRAAVEKKLRTVFHDPGLALDATLFAGLEGKQGGELRRAAKAIMAKLCNVIAVATARGQDEVARRLSELFAERHFEASKKDVMALLAPKLV